DGGCRHGSSSRDVLRPVSQRCPGRRSLSGVFACFGYDGMQSSSGIDVSEPLTLKPKVTDCPVAMLAFQPEGPAISMSPMVEISVFHELVIVMPEFGGHSQWIIQSPMLASPVLVTVISTVAPSPQLLIEASAVQVPSTGSSPGSVGSSPGSVGSSGSVGSGLFTPPSLPGRSAFGLMPETSPLPPSNTRSEQA